MDEKVKEAYEKGFSDAMKMKEKADGCIGCAYDDVMSWELPCRQCKRNSKDYWRAKFK